jgi:hypothetical protein
MIVIYTYITRVEVYRSDPIFIKDKKFEQQIKGTIGITGLYFLRVLINGNVWHLDVDLSHPVAEDGFKG